MTTALLLVAVAFVCLFTYFSIRSDRNFQRRQEELIQRKIAKREGKSKNGQKTQ